MMDLRLRIILIILIIIALVILFHMVRKKHLELRYSLVWFLMGLGILICSVFPRSIDALSALLGIASPMNMLFFIGFIFALAIIYTLTMAVSRMAVRIKNLAQSVALLEKRLEDKIEKMQKEM